MTMTSKSVKYNELEIKIGNRKLGTDTIIFNMGPAHFCPSRINGTCRLGDKCYALKAERIYKDCLPARVRQAEYWLNASAIDIIQDLERILNTKKVRVGGRLTPVADTVAYLRLNESGDFYSQECIQKADQIALHLKRVFGITTYTYSARSDLDFSGLKALIVRGSGHDACKHGKTIARPKKTILKRAGECLVAGIHGLPKVYNEKGENYLVCPMNCRTCDYCKKDMAINVVFPLH